MIFERAKYPGQDSLAGEFVLIYQLQKILPFFLGLIIPWESSKHWIAEHCILLEQHDQNAEVKPSFSPAGAALAPEEALVTQTAEEESKEALVKVEAEAEASRVRKGRRGSRQVSGFQSWDNQGQSGGQETKRGIQSRNHIRMKASFFVSERRMSLS